MRNVILASASRYKIDSMKKSGVPFVAIDSEVDEKKLPRENAYELVKELSKLKARAVYNKNPDSIVIGVDSVGRFKGRILEKPKNKEEAIKRLKMLSGKEHSAITGITIINGGKESVEVVETKIYFRELSNEEIIGYVEEDKDLVKYCLGYDPEGKISATFIKSINGSYNNILSGMPVEKVKEMLDTPRPDN